MFLVTFERSNLDSDADGRRTIVLRPYEAYGRHDSVSVLATVPRSPRRRVIAACETNLAEGRGSRTTSRDADARLGSSCPPSLSRGVAFVPRD